MYKHKNNKWVPLTYPYSEFLLLSIEFNVDDASNAGKLDDCDCKYSILM